MKWLGLDIGGVNLKAADGRGWARSVPFALAQRPNELAHALRELISTAPSAERLAVTMTGELCDCFCTKAEGVCRILAAVEEAAAGREVRVYLVDSRLVSVDEAREFPHRAAASNWHALASIACRYTAAKPGLLIDIGSTTTDLIPLAGGHPCAAGMSDTERLVAGELVYTGVARTPVCAVTKWLPWLEGRCHVAAECFATTADVYVILGELQEEPQATWTADGRPLTAEFARARLARMICADAWTFDEADARRAAEAVRDAQIELLRDMLSRVIARMADRPECVVLSGTGEFLARQVAADFVPPSRIVSLADKLGNGVSVCGPAHAVAVLATEAETR